MGEDKKYLTISEFRRAVGIPLVLAKRLVVWGQVSATRAVDGTIQIAVDQVDETKEFLKNPWRKTALFVKALGPGLITGASDDDPSGIGTYSSVGAQFGYGLIWLAPWLLPLMMAVQESCARIGIITNKGLSGVLQKHYKKGFVAVIVFLLIIANIVNIGADIQAMAASVQLLWHGNFLLIASIITAVAILIEIFVPYRNYVKVLKWLTISLFAYVITGFIIHPDWSVVFREAIIPSFDYNKEYIFAIVAVFGTTISPYLFFWQTSEEVEEVKLEKEENCKLAPRCFRIKRMRTDVSTGMIFSNLVFLFIVITTAEVLFKNGITSIDSAEQAALALKPFAGDRAFLLFALGIVGTGLLAVPVLAGSGAYALAELMNWDEGLSKKFSQAKAFYIVIALSILFGFSMNFLGINPIMALYYAAFLNGVMSVPLLFVIMVVGGDKKIMGLETHPKWVKFFGWSAFVFSVIAVILAIVTNI